MPFRTDLFYKNRLYQLLSSSAMYSEEILYQLNALLHEQPELVECNHLKEGSFYHVICRNSHHQENIAFRMIYALSNAGADPNVIDGRGNTPLHQALIRGLSDCGFDLIQALFRVGVDPRIVNHEGKRADAYLGDNLQLAVLYKDYGDGIWAAVETSNFQETERLIKGFIQPNCKHNSNKSLLDKARDIDYTSIIDILAEYQVTIEFLHSIIAYDWERASIIYKHENEYLKINSFDTIHRLTSTRTYFKSLLEYCLDTHSLKPFEILYNSPGPKINVNFLCTDGQPFFFHCFDEIISDEIRTKILSNCNMYIKSSKGETILFHLLHLYSTDENPEYLNMFTKILSVHPLLLVERDEQEQTIIEYIEFSNSMYKQYRPFYDAIIDVLTIQLKRNSIIERYILNCFGYYLLTLFKAKTLQMTEYVHKLILSLKSNQDLPVWISNMMQAIVDDDLRKLKEIFKMKFNIFLAKNSFGRTCAHLAVLYQRYEILKFICIEWPNTINATDNLHRTSFHYASIMNDRIAIEILEQVNARQVIDCWNLCPNDYLVNRDLCSEEYSAGDFVNKEIERKSMFSSNYLKLAFYPRLKKAIEKNSIEEMELIHQELIQMGFHLKDLNPNSSLYDYVQGERYIPLLFLAFQHRSYASLQCLLEFDIPLIGQIYLSRSEIDASLYWGSFRSRMKELECFDIIDVINDFDEDVQLKAVLQQHLSSNENTMVKIEEPKNASIEEKISKRQKIIRNFFPFHNTKSQVCILL